MNLFRVIASGKHSFREEFVSAFFAYLLSPNMDHGLGTSFFASLVKNLGEQRRNQKLLALASDLGDALRTDMFDEENGQVDIDIEFRYDLPGGTSGFVDIIARYKNWYFVIENKILHSSKTKDQLRDQYLGTKQRLTELHDDEFSIVQIYLVPALPGKEGWSSSQAFQDELHDEYQDEDFGSLLYWQKPDDTDDLSVIVMLRDLLAKESMGEISPLAYDTKQMLKSFVDFCLGEFTGYNYTQKPQRKPATNEADKISVRELLQQQDELYVGIQYGKAGLIIKAWRNSDFINEKLSISTVPKGWQYLPLSVFKIIAVWAMDPDNYDLKGLEWQGKPFGAVNLYRVAKTAGSDIFIGMRGGLTKLKEMNEEDFFAKKMWAMWEVSNTKKSVSWFSGEEYCEVVEAKNIKKIIDQA